MTKELTDLDKELQLTFDGVTVNQENNVVFLDKKSDYVDDFEMESIDTIVDDTYDEDFLNNLAALDSEENKEELNNILFKFTNMAGKLETRAARLTELLTETNKQLDFIKRKVLVEIFEKNKIPLLVSDGRTFKFKEDLFASLPKDAANRQVCLQFLRDRELGSLIQMEVKAICESKEVMTKAVDTLTEQGISSEAAETVNTNSLKAVMRELLGYKKGKPATLTKEDIPTEFNLFIDKVVDIK